MKRFVLACAVLLCGPAFGNERADSEAKLAALAGPVIAALEAAMPTVEGITCVPGTQDPSPTNRMYMPNWQADCSWGAGGRTERTRLVMILSPSAVDSTRRVIQSTKDKMASGKVPADFAQFFGQPDARAMLTELKMQAAPSDLIAVLADAPRDGAQPFLPQMQALGQAFAAMDTAALEALPEVQAHVEALAVHRGILERQRENLAAVLAAAVVGKPATPMLPADTYPDFMFFGAEPLVQTNTIEAGVGMVVTLTTSAFALENAFADKQFVGRHKSGETGPGGVFNDRGRVQVYLRDNQMTALIDGRGMLMLYVPDEVAGTDPLAAMEAVLARIAANDFSGY